MFITGPFGLADQISAALAEPSDKLRYELLEAADRDLMRGPRRRPRQPGRRRRLPGRAGGWHQFLREQLTGLNEHVKYVHTKYLLVDPLTADPTVVTGSANFSAASTNANDENMLVIRGDTRVADIYLTEFMRLFTHMRFRGAGHRQGHDRRAPDPAEPDITAPLPLEDRRQLGAPRTSSRAHRKRTRAQALRGGT